MPRFAFAQTGPRNCGGAALMVALAETGHIAQGLINAGTQTMIYGMTQRAPGGESSPANIIRYAQSVGATSWLLEAPWRTAVLMAGAPRQLGPAWLLYSNELWSSWVWRYPRSLWVSDLERGRRAMLASIIMTVGPNQGALHWVLARREGFFDWVMNPDGGTDERDDDLMDYINGLNIHTYGGVNYLYAGVAIIIE